MSIDVWFVMIGQYLAEIQLFENLRVQKNLNIEKIAFKVVQMKFLAMHITNPNFYFYIFMEGYILNIFMEHDLNILMIFGIKEKCIIFTHTMYCGLLLQTSPSDWFCAPGTHMSERTCPHGGEEQQPEEAEDWCGHHLIDGSRVDLLVEFGGQVGVVHVVAVHQVLQKHVHQSWGWPVN